jgi:hypothetical protein
MMVDRSQCPRRLSRGRTAAIFLGLRVRIPPTTEKYACCECCLMSGRGICVGPITRPEEYYRV